MTNPDLTQWEERYRNEAYPAGTEPAALLCELLPLLKPGHALDLACGSGRNAVFLANHSWWVTAIDDSPTALERATCLARQANITVHRGPVPSGRVSSKDFRLVLLQADLETFALPKAQFDLVICFNYLQRSLFPVLPDRICSRGMIVYETYTLAQRARGQGPRSPAHLLRPGELRTAFPTLEILFYREWCTHRAVASLLARRP